jgi:dienelactone hydrolase
MRSAADLWRGYDPAALPLEIAPIRSWEEKGCSLQKLRFTGEVADGRKTRILAIQGAPAGPRRGLPGILHIHGGGQTASLDWVIYWAKRGYVCVSFDFCGRWEGRTEYTDWGPIEHANMAKAGSGYQVNPTPRESSWFHWAKAARRALTLLEGHPAVDPERLGIFGVSVGGNLTWFVAGSDARVKTAVPIYGSGYNLDARYRSAGFEELTDDLQVVKRTLTPEAHAPYVSCPVLHLDATNDFHAKMDGSYEILSAVRAPVRQAFTPRYDHHVEPEQGADLERWMAWQLRAGAPFPATPDVAIHLDARGVPEAALRIPGGTRVRRVAIYYALGNQWPSNRFWRSAEAVGAGRLWKASLPVMDAWQTVLAFANVTYQSGVCLTSNLARTIPGQLGRAAATLEWSADMEQEPTGPAHWFFTRAYTDPNLSDSYVRTETVAARRCVTLNPALFGEPMRFTLSTHAPGDPQYQGRSGTALAFDCRGAFGAAGLTIRFTGDEWTPRARAYTSHAQPREDTPDWQTITLPRSSFADAAGQHPPAWRGLQHLEIEGAAARRDPPCFSRIRWVPQG